MLSLPPGLRGQFEEAQKFNTHLSSEIDFRVMRMASFSTLSRVFSIGSLDIPSESVLVELVGAPEAGKRTLARHLSSLAQKKYPHMFEF